jgi:hypothetical protein
MTANSATKGKNYNSQQLERMQPKELCELVSKDKNAAMVVLNNNVLWTIKPTPGQQHPNFLLRAAIKHHPDVAVAALNNTVIRNVQLTKGSNVMEYVVVKHLSAALEALKNADIFAISSTSSFKPYDEEHVPMAYLAVVNHRPAAEYALTRPEIANLASSKGITVGNAARRRWSNLVSEMKKPDLEQRLLDARALLRKHKIKEDGALLAEVLRQLSQE